MNVTTDKAQFVQVQEDLAYALLSWSELDRINVVQERKLRAQERPQEAEPIDESIVWCSPRNGRYGCGILVEMPSIDFPSASAPGPQQTLTLSCLVLEQPTMNMHATQGTLLDAETVAYMVSRCLHGWFHAGRGETFIQRRGIEPASTDLLPGIIAYRVSVGVQLVGEGWQRLTCPTISETGLTAGLTVTLTNVAENPDATIYYTTDGSMPGSGNPAARQYEAPFVVDTGTVVRFGCWQEGWLPSAVDKVTVS